MAEHVGVVGAGISGLAAARELLAAGYKVSLFEASERCGGVLGSEQTDSFVMDRTASSFVPTSDGAISLAQELGVPLEEASKTARNRWVYIDGKMQVVPTSARQLLRSPLLSWRGKFRALAEPLQPTHPGADESIADFCRRRLGAEATRGLVAPFVTGVFGGDAEQLSLRACFPSLSALEARGGLLRGAAATKVEAVFSRMQGAATAKRGHKIMAPCGGVESLVRALGKELEPNLYLETSIASLERAEHGHTLHAADGTHYHVDALVLTTPAAVSASLVAPHDQKMAQALRDIPYAPMVVVGVGFEAPISNALDGFGFLVAKGEAVRTLGVVFESSVWSERAPTGGVLLRCMMGGVRDPEILDCSDPEIIAAALGDLKSILGIHETPSYVQVIRWPRAIPQYTIGHLKREEQIVTSARELGLVVGGSALGGVSVNDCIANAKQVVKEVAVRLSAIATLLVMIGMAAGCGASNKGTAVSPMDAGVVSEVALDASASFVPAPDLPLDLGTVEVMARWLWPDPKFRRSGGRNSCGVARKPALSVELMGGLNATAITSTTGLAPAGAQISVFECRLEPALVVVGVGEPLHLRNLGEQAHELVIEEIDASGILRKEVGRAAMRVAGQTFLVPTSQAAILRIHTHADPKDFSYALVSSGAAAVTSHRGFAQIDLPVGVAQLQVWHAPVIPDTAPIVSTLSVEVKAQIRSKHIVDLKN